MEDVEPQNWQRACKKCGTWLWIKDTNVEMQCTNCGTHHVVLWVPVLKKTGLMK